MMFSTDVEILIAPFTPMHGDESIHYQLIESLFDYYTTLGVKGVFINGTTGECMSLSTEERMLILEEWVKAKNQQLKNPFDLFAHVGSCNLKESVRMAEHAESLGINGVAMVSPFYFKPGSVRELVSQCAFVASAAPKTPFYYYNIPYYTGVQFPLLEFCKLAYKKIPNFAGIKSSHNNTTEYLQCMLFAKNKFTMYWGIDENFINLYAAGNISFIGSTYNYMLPIYQKMVEAFKQKKQKKFFWMQKTAFKIYDVLSKYEGIPAGKEMMSFIGLDCGPVRLPLKKIDLSEKENILKALTKSGYFNHVKSFMAPVNS